MANAGYNFVQWEIYYGNEITATIITNTILNITDVRSDITCVAVFEKMDITLTINTTIEGELISEGIDKVSIKYESGAIGESISTGECLSMTLNAKTNTDIIISATAKEGYTFGEFTPVYTVEGNVSVIISGNKLIINAKENNIVVNINFGKRNNVIDSVLNVESQNGGGIIRYQENEEWQHIGPRYTTSSKTENTLTYKVFVYTGYNLGAELLSYVNNGVYTGDGYKLTIIAADDYTGLDQNYFTAVYDVTIYDFKTDINVIIPIDRLKTVVTFHNFDVNDPTKTFTANIIYGTKTIVGATTEQLLPTSETYEFIGWETELGYLMIDSTGNLKSEWYITDNTYDLYAVWKERLLQIVVEVDPIYALQSASTLYKTLFANSFVYGLQPEEQIQNGNVLYYTRPISKLYLTLPQYKTGYIFDGFYLKNPTTDEYEKVGQAGDGTNDYATSTNCLLNIQGYSYYTNYQDSSRNGTIVIKLSFKVITSISAENYYGDRNRVAEIGGTVKFVDISSFVNGSIISVETNTNTTIKMVATPIAGYEFVKWVDEDDNEILTPEFEVDVTQSKHYKAIFVGERILITSDYNIEIEGGNQEEYSSETYYHVGDIVKFKFNDKVVGYNHTNWMLYDDNGIEISLITGTNPSYTLTSNYKNIKVNPTFTMANIKVQIIMSGQGEGDGTIKFASGWTVKYNKTNNVYELTMEYRTNLEFNIIPNIRYKLDNATVKYGNETQKIVDVQDNVFKINYEDYNDVRTIQININFVETYWREYVIENGQIIDNGDGTYSVSTSGDFIGDGTEEYPYELNNISDISKLAFIINNNIKQNNNKKAEYVDAVYELNQNIDFKDRFWTPIGTKTNPFKGTFYIRGDRNNIIVNDNDPLFPTNQSFETDKDYYTLYGKLFGCLDGAKIILEQQSLLVLWIVLGVLAGITIIIVLLVVISNQRRKNITKEKTILK